jgi:hypothetical protein
VYNGVSHFKGVKMEQELDANAIIRKFQEKLSEAQTALVILETQLEQAKAEIERLTASVEP